MGPCIFFMCSVPEWDRLGTDRGADVLDNCTRNVVTNSSLYVTGDGAVQVRKLDWLQPWPLTVSYDAEDRDEQETLRWTYSCVLNFLFLIVCVLM